MARDLDCVFCHADFPVWDQLISDAPRYWLVVHHLKPLSRLHTLIVLKAAVFEQLEHRPDLALEALPQPVLLEFGAVLSRASHTIRKSDDQVDRVLIVSPETGQTPQHPHLHLIPNRKNEPVTTPTSANELLSAIQEPVHEGLKADVERLRSNFKWSPTGP